MGAVGKFLAYVFWAGLLPVCTGLFVCSFLRPADRKVHTVITLGYLASFSLFECFGLVILFTTAVGDFSLLVTLYAITVCMLSVLGVIRVKKTGGLAGSPFFELLRKKPWRTEEGRKEIDLQTLVFWLCFLALLAFELVMSWTHASYDGDDAYYVAQSVQTWQTGTMYHYVPYTGITTELDGRHAMAMIPMWIAAIAKLCGTHPTIVTHSLIPLVFLPLADLCAYSLISALLYDKDSKKRTGRMIPAFMTAMALLQKHHRAAWLLQPPPCRPQDRGGREPAHAAPVHGARQRGLGLLHGDGAALYGLSLRGREYLCVRCLPEPVVLEEGDPLLHSERGVRHCPCLGDAAGTSVRRRPMSGVWGTIVAYSGTGFLTVLYVIALVTLFLREDDRANRILFLYLPACFLVLFLLPPVRDLYAKIEGMETYYRFLWLIPMAMAVLALLCGQYTYSNANILPAQNRLHLPQVVIDVSDYIVNAAGGQRTMVAMPPELVQFVRQYDSRILMPYGREMLMPQYADYYQSVYDVMTADVIDGDALVAAIREYNCNYFVMRAEKMAGVDLSGTGILYLDTVDGYNIYQDPGEPQGLEE